jgi:hypothetical protein
MPGRPTVAEHRHPYDEVRRPTDRQSTDPLTMLHILTILAAEQQTMNFYMNAGNIPVNPLTRGLYLEIAQIEEQHVNHYESLLDPNASWLEQEILHQSNECYMYYSFMQQESDRRIWQLWELHLNMELEHLRIACELMRNYEKRDPEQFLPKELPEPVHLEENKQYVRQVLANQVALTADGTEFVPVKQLPEDARYFSYQQTVNQGGVPSEQVIEEHIRQVGKDYRATPEGTSPLAVSRR